MQSITQKTKDLAVRAPIKIGVESGAPEAVPTPHVATVVILLNVTNIMWYWNRVGYKTIQYESFIVNHDAQYIEQNN